MRWKILMVGDSGAGKSTLCHALLSLNKKILKTQCPEYYEKTIIDIPGEYLMHPHLRRNFLAIAEDAESLIYIQSAVGKSLGLPPGLLNLRPKQNLIGIINKIDLPEANIESARKNLKSYGVPEPYREVSAIEEESVAMLRDWLVSKGFL